MLNITRHNSTSASHVLAFDHKIRRGPSYWHSIGINNTQNRGPLFNAHVDQSYDGALVRLRKVIPGPEAKDLCKRRWQIINVPFPSPLS